MESAKRKKESQYLKIFERKKCSKYYIDSSYHVFLMHAYASETHITIHRASASYTSWAFFSHN